MVFVRVSGVQCVFNSKHLVCAPYLPALTMIDKIGSISIHVAYLGGCVSNSSEHAAGTGRRMYDALFGPLFGGS